MYRSGQRVVTQAIQKYLGSSYDVVKTVYDNLTDVSAVADNLDDVTSVADNLTLLLGLQNLADNADKVVDVADNLDDVTSVADNLTDVSAVADNIVAVTEVNAKVDDFNTKYLGSYASAPTVDGNGDPLVEGATYWDTTLNAMFVYTGSQWVKPTGTGIVDVDTFTGDGSTASFPLDVSPASKTNTSVFIDGVYQEKDTYSVSTNLITFNTAPNDEASIEVIVNEITNFITGTQTETHTLTSGQTVVNLTNSPAFASFHTQGEDVDSQRLDLGTDYTLDLLTNTITLTNSYPENTVLKMLYGYDDDISVELAPLNQAILDHVNATENAHPASAIQMNNGENAQNYLGGSNSEYITVEQETGYTMTHNRHVFGEEYLWGFHKQILTSGNTNSNKFVWSGDSTTYGVYAGIYTPSFIGTLVCSEHGLAKHTHINAGHSGESAVDWNNTHVDNDIANHPDMNVYVARWGINHPSQDVPTTIAAMESALGKLRAFKDVGSLAIVLVSPNSTYDEPNDRSTSWYESLIPEMRKIARKYKCTFIDIYSIWQDAKQGALGWLDDPFGDLRGIHPDPSFALQIGVRITEIIIKPIMFGQNFKANKLSNSDPDSFLPSLSTAPSGYHRGVSLWGARTANGWPVNGKLRAFRNGKKVIQELYPAEDDGVQTGEQSTFKIVRFGDTVVDTWSKWYNSAVAPTLINSWAVVASRPPRYIHTESGLCTLCGTVNTGADGTTMFTIPAEMRPLAARTFPVTGDGVTGAVVINTNGNVDGYYNGGTFINLDGVNWMAGI